MKFNAIVLWGGHLVAKGNIGPGKSTYTSYPLIWYSSCSLSSSSPSYHYQEHLSKTGQFLEGGSNVFVIIIIVFIIAMHCLQVWKEDGSYSRAEAHLLRGRVLRGGGAAQWFHQNKVRFFLLCLCFSSTFFTLQMLKFVYATDHRRLEHTDLKSQWMAFTQSPSVCNNPKIPTRYILSLQLYMPL